jgi:hydroxymethylpyrimidine pyrophosphatase-like HAD family hydrolase
MGVNKDLGLPFGEGMERIAFCFDIDGTLIDEEEKHVNTIKLLVAMGEQKWKNVKVVVWSGGGREYAETFVRRLGLESHVDMVMGKIEYQRLRDEGYRVIAVDDVQDTRLGDVNLIVRNK